MYYVFYLICLYVYTVGIYQEYSHALIHILVNTSNKNIDILVLTHWKLWYCIFTRFRWKAKIHTSYWWVICIINK